MSDKNVNLDEPSVGDGDQTNKEKTEQLIQEIENIDETFSLEPYDLL